jgi:hypothetical protein
VAVVNRGEINGKIENVKSLNNISFSFNFLNYICRAAPAAGRRARGTLLVLQCSKINYNLISSLLSGDSRSAQIARRRD